MSSDPVRITGRFTDGETAAVHDVDLVIGDGSITITGDTVAVSWPVARIKRLPDRPDGAVILSLKGSDARLSIDPHCVAAVRAALPRLLDQQRSRRGTLLLGGALTGTAAAIAAFIFLGLPALSRPLARAVPPEVELRMGAQTNQLVAWFTDECETSPEAQAALDRLGARIETASGSPFEFKLRIVDADFPNAFALPGGWIVVTDDLIDIMESPDELAGVLAHEGAHVARRHVMAAQLREMGLGVMLDFLVGGGSGAGQEIARTGATLETLRHTRTAEAEADRYALEYLAASDMNPAALADFFERMHSVFEDVQSDDEAGTADASSEDAGPDAADAAEAETAETRSPETDTTDTPTTGTGTAETGAADQARPGRRTDRTPDWVRSVLRTHPDTAERAREARLAAADIPWSGTPSLNADEWAALQGVCDGGGIRDNTSIDRIRDRLEDAITRPRSDDGTDGDAPGAEETTPDQAGEPPASDDS